MNDLSKNSETMPDLQELELIMKYCDLVAKAPAYQAMGGMAGVFALVMTARELGIGPMMALNGGMYLIPPGIDKEGRPKGQPTIMMAAKTMSMMIWKNCHKIEIVECNNNSVTLKGTRNDNGVEMTVNMNMQKAKEACLSHDSYGKPKMWSTWFKNSEDMLWKTCVAKLGRRLFTDVIGNCYEPSEFSEQEDKNKGKKETKILKGKNIESIENRINSEIEVNKEELDKFIKENEIDENNSSDMTNFIKECAFYRNLDFQKTLNLCFINKEKFLEKFESHINKKNDKIFKKQDSQNKYLDNDGNE